MLLPRNLVEIERRGKKYACFPRKIIECIDLVSWAVMTSILYENGVYLIAYVNDKGRLKQQRPPIIFSSL